MKQTILFSAAIIMAIAFSACSTQRRAAINEQVLQSQLGKEEPIAMVGVGHQLESNPNSLNAGEKEASMFLNKPVDEATANVQTMHKSTTSVTLSKTAKKAKSFAQMKEMVKNGDIAMGAKDLKTLNKLDKLYKGNFSAFKSDAFEMTGTAKIIAGVGAASALIAIFVGSWFFAFLFLLAVLAFLLRWIGIIEF